MKRFDVLKCEKCGNIFQVRLASGVMPLCCGEEMKLLEEKTAEMSTEKHVPMVEKVENGYKVTVGSTIHPMEDKHFIGWIEIISENENYVKYLKPGDEPVFEFNFKSDIEKAREYCNLHGLWKS